MYLITNRKLCSEERYLEVIKESILSGVENIIIREKDLEYQELKKLYMKIKTKINCIDFQEQISDESLKTNINQKECRNKFKVNFIINSNIEFFEKVDCQGIHLPFKLFLNLIENKYNFNENKILGLSLHKVEEVDYLEKLIRNQNIKIDYITLSHIYETKCKEGLSPKGIELLKEAKKITDIKIIALGGILPSNVKETLKYCDDFAIMSTIMKSKDIKKTISNYNEKLN
ncbi:thiamine phosphate synthase [Clostridioides difficile]|uniref:thiamine phosphate synthase n=1 Tax=Clostridioides difficile TaxID=1496 RepID=UPI000872AC62|nr:thiamine phosphate synthase [Clostridioides difficile]AXU50023.1 thiamine biosynthesis protein [Clostridioides difficile]EGT4943450.1 thiamine phosphate synthase [Clostridioides difficile]MBS4862128.1 thiamine phosphate synthase [Clostridioides difficile]MCI4261865.1 thiamine phosphate synthase [Clostridioides difficile]MCK1950479.1 thiamine phosphate synthase [Clostridioides difficile]